MENLGGEASRIVQEGPVILKIRGKVVMLHCASSTLRCQIERHKRTGREIFRATSSSVRWKAMAMCECPVP